MVVYYNNVQGLSSVHPTTYVLVATITTITLCADGLSILVQCDSSDSQYYKKKLEFKKKLWLWIGNGLS